MRSWWSRGWAQGRAGITLVSSSVSQLVLPQLPSQAWRGCGTPVPDTVTSCHHRCEAAFEWCQVTTKVSVLSKGMAPGSPVPPVQSRPPPLRCWMEPASPISPPHPLGLPWNAGDTMVPSQQHGSNREPPRTVGMECGSSDQELEQGRSGDRVAERGPSGGAGPGAPAPLSGWAAGGCRGNNAAVCPEHTRGPVNGVYGSSWEMGEPGG